MRGRLVPIVLVTLASPLLWPAAAQAAVVRCHGERATIVGTDKSDVIRGTTGDDVIAGLQGNDIIHGRGGNDRICGNAGADELFGGAGADRLFGGRDLYSENGGDSTRTGDVLSGGRGNDRLVPGRDTTVAETITHDSLSWRTSPHAMTIDMGAGIATGDGQDSFNAVEAFVVGSKYADVIDGSERGDIIKGGPGSDVIRGHEGNDRIVSDPGSKAGDDKVWGGRGNDHLTSGGGQDVVRGGSGGDRIDDLADSADLLYGGAGGDFLIGELSDSGKPQGYFGGSGIDRLELHTGLLNPTAAKSTGTWDMGTGRLVFHRGGSLVITVGGIQSAYLSTPGTSWTVRGTEAADFLGSDGTSGITFRAFAGNDIFGGSDFDDVFNGGSGTDHSLGMGLGDDTCRGVEVFDSPDCEHVLP